MKILKKCKAVHVEHESEDNFICRVGKKKRKGKKRKGEKKKEKFQDQLFYGEVDVVSYHVRESRFLEFLFTFSLYSGWHHQVRNLEPTISINHNWCNAHTLPRMWGHLQHELGLVQAELADCTDMPDWEGHCQVKTTPTCSFILYSGPSFERPLIGRLPHFRDPLFHAKCFICSINIPLLEDHFWKTDFHRT